LMGPTCHPLSVLLPWVHMLPCCAARAASCSLFHGGGLRCRVCPRPPIEPPRLRRHPFLPPRGCPTLPPAPLRAAARPADRTSSRRRLPLAPTSTRDLRDSVCRCRLALHQPPPAPALANVHHYAGGAALCRPTPTAVGPSAGLVPRCPCVGRCWPLRWPSPGARACKLRCWPPLRGRPRPHPCLPVVCLLLQLFTRDGNVMERSGLRWSLHFGGMR